MFGLLFNWPALLTRALDDLHQLARASRSLEEVATISRDLRALNKRLASVEGVLRELARPARTTDTIIRAMPGSKTVAARAKAQRDRARAARPAKPPAKD